jgi:nucleolar complex protein 3
MTSIRLTLLWSLHPQQQTSVLDQVFLTYFRILKQAPDSQLLSPALKGLAKFAHLINVDFFADLMSVLSSLLASGVGVV